MDNTKEVYENSKFVKAYIQTNADKEFEIKKATEFAQKLKPRSYVLDLGCGPGHLSYVIANAKDVEGNSLNHKVLGTDYSSEMIKEAKTLREQDNNMPLFEVQDMTMLENDYRENTFDAIFSNAAILHIDIEKLPNVLRGIVKVTKNNGIVFINLKRDQPGTRIVNESKKIEDEELTFSRDFTFWDGDDFVEEAKKYGLILESKNTQTFPSTSGKLTEWLNFYFVVEK